MSARRLAKPSNARELGQLGRPEKIRRPAPEPGRSTGGDALGARPLPQAAGFFWGWLVVLVVVTRPFRGIFQDGHLYAAQALQRLEPGALRHDVFFAYGSQDSFTAFSAAYAPVIDAIGLFDATFAFWAMGLLFWVGALAVLARSLMPSGRDALIAAASVLCLYAGYGNMQLGYGEAWVTPRPWAEGLCMMAIAAALRRRAGLAAVASLLAALLHPLIALSGAALAFWLLCRSKRIFLVVAAVVAALSVGAGAIGLGPFAWLFERIDDAWWDVIARYVTLVQVGAWWHLALLIWLPLPIASLWLVWSRGAPRHRDLIAGVIVIGAGFTILSFLFTDMLHNRLFTALQLWRAEIWIALFGNLFAWSAYRGLPAGSRGKPVFAAALVLTAVPAIAGLPPISGGILAVAAVLIDAGERRGPGRMRPVLFVSGMMLILAAVLGLPAMMIFFQDDWSELFWRMISLLIAAVAVWSILRGGNRIGGIALAVCLPLAVVSADKRAGWEVFLADGNAIPQAFSERLDGKSVYWEDELGLVWFGLGMPNFYSCRHLSGVVFHRGQAMEVVRRAAMLSVLGRAGPTPRTASNCPHVVMAKGQRTTAKPSLAQVCAALPDVDFIVLNEKLASTPLANWAAPKPDGSAQSVPVFLRRNADRETTTYFLYACAGQP